MKKLMSIYMILAMSITMFVIMPANVNADTPYFLRPNDMLMINDFETNVFTSANSGQIGVSKETTNPLNGLSSMKMAISGLSDGWQYIYDNASSFPDGSAYDGFIFRLKSGANGENALLNLFVDGVGFPRAYFINAVKLFDLSKNKIANATYNNDWGAIELPANFDGYVYMPFSGTKGQTAFDPSKITSVCFGFIGGNWWNSTSTYIDDFAYYTESAVSLPLEPLVINDFEANVFSSANSGQITVSKDAVNPLNGLSSMKVGISNLSDGWQYIYDNVSVFPDGSAYDGFIFRLKSGVNSANALFKLFVDGAGFPRAEFIYDVQLLDLSKNKIADATYNNDWGAIELPANFDGYVYMPFSGTKGQTAFDASKVTSVCFGFVGGHWWNSTSTYIDDLAYCTEPGAAPPSPEAHVINDFEANVFTSANSGQVAVSKGTVNPLNGLSSMKADISNLSDGWQYIYDNTSVFPDGSAYDGFIFRLKSGAIGENALFKLFVDGTGFPRAEFINGVQLLDLSKDKIATAAYNNDWGAIELPANFDGYVFMPFSGTKGQTAFDASKISSIAFGFIGGNWWNGTTTYIDDLEYATISELPPEPLTGDILFDFEGGTHNFRVGNDMSAAVSLTDTNPLSGTKSLKVDCENPFVSTWAQVSDNTSPVPKGLDNDGIVFRIKANTADTAIMVFTLGVANQGVFDFQGDIQLRDTEHHDVTIGLKSDWVGFWIPPGFDGYVYIPFSGAVLKSGTGTFDADAINSVAISFVSPVFEGKSVLLDDIKYYKGEIPTTEAPPDEKEGQHTYMLNDFETGTGFLANQDITLNDRTANPLIGTGSLNFRINDIESMWTQLWSGGVSGKPGYDGVVMRYKTNAPISGGFGVVIVQDSSRKDYGNGVRYFDITGLDVTPSPSYISDWHMSIMPNEFDGYVFFPFSTAADNGDGNDIDFSKSFEIRLSYVRAAYLDKTAHQIDSLAFYKGVDYEAITTELGHSFDGIDSDIINIDETPLINKIYGITIQEFAEGSIPSNTFQKITAVTLTNAEKAAIANAYAGSNPQIQNAYNFRLEGLKKNEVFISDMISVRFKLPQGSDITKYTVCMLPNDINDGLIVKFDSFYDNLSNEVVIYTSKLARMVVLYTPSDSGNNDNNPGDTDDGFVFETDRQDNPDSGNNSNNQSGNNSNETTDSNSNTQTNDNSYDQNIDSPVLDADIVNELTIEKINELISAAETDTVSVRINNSGILTVEMQQALKDAGIKLKVEVADDNGEVILVWQFGVFNEVFDDIDLSCRITSDYERQLFASIPDALDYKYISFNYHGSLPDGTVVIVKNTNNFTKQDLIKVVYYNQDTKSLQFLDKQVLFTSDLSYIGFAIEHCSDYLFVKYDRAANSAVTPDAKSDIIETASAVWIYFAIGGIVLAALVSAVFLIFKRRRKIV